MAHMRSLNAVYPALRLPSAITTKLKLLAPKPCSYHSGKCFGKVRVLRRSGPSLTKVFRPKESSKGTCFASIATDVHSVSADNTETSANPDAPTFQDAIQRLQSYWASKGCAMYLPHNTEVGAGTMNPATFLRCMGPEPWNVCYPEPSIRPDDSRYGDNPNRVQRHTQFQVIMKPDPGNSQELYLGSLQALGIDTVAHDIRFVEDNWESPVLGAWGLGWEVWMDGMEVTQFTYFQQVGSVPLKAVCVEITYGLERIIMNLQGTYGEMFMQNEYEMSCFNMDEANVEEHKARFELYDKEARVMLEKRLPIPAYDQLLKSSHAFNILDARGAVGVTERATFFAKMRSLARQCSGLWLERREELGFPLGSTPEPEAPVAVSDVGVAPEGERTFVLEVGTEELPAQEVSSAARQLQALMSDLLTKQNLAHGDVTVGATPRRVTVTVQALQSRQPDRSNRMRGPPAKIAFDAEGKPSKAAEGFCRKVNAKDVTVCPTGI
ncbi:glycine--tRNA ligase, chloroplastic/mitochondrial, variant 2 [Cymbomonas tetramitiformis]|uniref:glycine--tRNA ligase n=1 Tax=Cymbomonas tetramitiformis TaxID=36881 RepID=A0AAE0GGN7_9CHLO|nr:glycine--tRNA ligase, chloroplastic/mitochondrial, variant 2 [Cymbomonas tetramitiformis]